MQTLDVFEASFNHVLRLRHRPRSLGWGWKTRTLEGGLEVPVHNPRVPLLLVLQIVSIQLRPWRQG
eukprot:1700083-Rhodomonas_salina.1